MTWIRENGGGMPVYLPSGDFDADDGECILRIWEDSEGVHIWHIDLSLDICHQWLFDSVTAKVRSFEITSPYITLGEEREQDKQGK